MADVELVIKIPEGLRKNFELEQWTALSCMEMKDALEKATQLPKGHGKLVDLDQMCEDYWDGNYMEIHEDDLLNIKPIIEADRPGNKEADGIRPKADTPREDYEPEYGR